jgi:formate hydrogenlyase subunit 6/NADH:ubiquinone oxidoreductase subunit I
MVRTYLPRRIEITFNPSFCKGCAICSEIACHRNVWEMVKDDDKITGRIAKLKANYKWNCTGCGYCELLCPDQALNVKGGY